MLARGMDERRRRFEAQALPHLDAAYNLARWLARSPTDAEDIVQDALLRAYKAYDSLHGGDIKPWLLAIVRNCFRTEMRKAVSRKIVPLPQEAVASGPEFVSLDPDPENSAIAAQERRRLDEVLADLPEEFREVLVLREL